MKATLTELKTRIMKSVVADYQYKLSTSNPFFMNAELIKALEEKIELQKQSGLDNPKLRYEISEKQEVSLKSWVRDLRSKFLFGG